MSDDHIPDAWTILRMAKAAGKARSFWYFVSALGLPPRLSEWRRPECASIWCAFQYGESLKCQHQEPGAPPTPH